MKIVLLGPPGAGKGTQAKSISNRYSIPHISTGDIFRKNISEETPLGIEAKQYIDNGQLVPDEVTVGMVKTKLDKLENVLLDGFPRTIDQAKALEEYLKEKGKEITAVIDLEVPDQDIIKRTSSRVICSNKECGASYNTVFMPPKVEGICDRCGSALTKRKDDNPETIKERLDVYHKNTEPLINFYKEENKLETIDIDIYSPTTKEDTTKSAIEKIENRIK